MRMKDLAEFGYPGYQIADCGLVYSEKRKKWLKPYANHSGYYRIHLNNQAQASVHRLVAMAFIPNPENKPEVDHIDNDPSNNSVENLRWANRRENLEHEFESGGLATLMSEKDVHLVCQRLEEGVGCSEISRIYGFSYDAVYQIKRGENWKHISSQYNITKPKQRSPMLTESNVRVICEQIVLGKSSVEIAEEFDFSYDVVAKIKSGKNWRSISREYF